MSKSIFFFWDNLNTCPKKYVENFNIARALHPDYEVEVIDDSAGKEEVKKAHSSLVEFYEKLKIPAAKSDVARLARLYNSGGWYLDADIRLRRSLHFMQDHPRVLFTRDDKDFPRISNMVMKFEARDPFLMDCLELIMRHYTYDIHQHDVWYLTGPGVVNALAWKYDIKEPNTFSFKEYFVDSMKTFLRVRSSTTTSWSYQQCLGVWEGCPYNFHALPKKFSSDMLSFISKWIDDNENKNKVLTDFIKARGIQYAEDAKFKDFLTDRLSMVDHYQSLRDIAITHEKDINFSHKLMSRAYELNSGGGTIKKKMEEYKKLLER